MTPGGRQLIYFLMLSPVEQSLAIRRMAASGWSDHDIARATRLSAEMVRRILAHANEPRGERQ